MPIHWKIKKFDALSTIELYRILKLRSDVFVVEQDCVYPDIDGKDLNAMHLFADNDFEVLAYARLLAPGSGYQQASIGRVVSHPNYRKEGYGKQLMEKAIALTCEIYETNHICISAQLYLIHFYEGLGFKTQGESYLEDGIPHIEMHYLR